MWVHVNVWRVCVSQSHSVCVCLSKSQMHLLFILCVRAQSGNLPGAQGPSCEVSVRGPECQESGEKGARTEFRFLGNGRGTFSRVVFRTGELTEPH